MKLQKNNGGFTLIELIIVIAILSLLMYVFYPAISGMINKNRDTTRVKVLQDYGAYYESSIASIGVFPGGGITNVGSSTSEKALAKRVTSQAVGNGYVSIFDFSGDRTAWRYQTSPLGELQDFLIANQTIGSANDIKTLKEGEHMAMFTSGTSTRYVGCVKLFAPLEIAQNDGDGIPDDQPADGADGHRNGNRIYVQGDMKLWNQLGDAARTICRNLPNPQDL